MPSITIIEASELFGKSKRTIQRYLSSGKLSFTEQGDNTKMLCIDELQAVFGELSPLVIAGLSPIVTPETTGLSTGNELLEKLLNATLRSNELAEEQNGLLRQLLASKPEAVTITEAVQDVEPYEPEAVTQYVTPSMDYLDDIPTFVTNN